MLDKIILPATTEDKKRCQNLIAAINNDDILSIVSLMSDDSNLLSYNIGNMQNAILYAVSKNKKATTKFLLKKAIEHECIKMLNKVTDIDETILNMDLGQGYNALLYAISKCKEKVVGHLLQEGLAYQEYDYNGERLTAKSIANKTGNANIIAIVEDPYCLEFDTSKPSSSSALTSTSIVNTSYSAYFATLPDGNCAFNAPAKCLYQRMLDLQGETLTDFLRPWYNYIKRMINCEDSYRFSIENNSPFATLLQPELTEAVAYVFVAALKRMHDNDRQRELARFLRHKTYYTMFHPVVYEAMYREGFEQRLVDIWHQFQLMSNEISNFEDDTGLLTFPALQAQFRNNPDISAVTLIDWWDNVGKFQYYQSMLTPCSHANENYKWGGDNEIALIALDHGINLRLLGKNEGFADTEYCVGIAEGMILESSLVLMIGMARLEQLLPDTGFAIAERIITLDLNLEPMTYIRLKQGAKQSLQLFSTPGLSQVQIDHLIKLQYCMPVDGCWTIQEWLAKEGRYHDITWLQQRQLLYLGRLLHFEKITTVDGRVLYPPDAERIEKHRNGVSGLTATTLSGLITPIEPDFTLAHEQNHWYVVSQEQTIEDDDSFEDSDSDTLSDSDLDAAVDEYEKIAYERTSQKRQHYAITQPTLFFHHANSTQKPIQFITFTPEEEQVLKNKIDHMKQSIKNARLRVEDELIKHHLSLKNIDANSLLKLTLRKISRETGEIYAYLCECKQSQLFDKLYLLGLVTPPTTDGYGGYFITNQHGLPDLGKIIATMNTVTVSASPAKKTCLR